MMSHYTKLSLCLVTTYCISLRYFSGEVCEFLDMPTISNCYIKWVSVSLWDFSVFYNTENEAVSREEEERHVNLDRNISFLKLLR